MKTAIYPGTFDPITYGHIDIIERATNLFDSVIVAIAKNPAKQPLFTVAVRKKMIKNAIADLPNVQVDCFDGLIVDYAELKKAGVIIRGLRAISDFEYELQMALMNRRLKDRIVTVFLMPHEQYVYLNSSIVREVASLGGDVSHLVSPSVMKMLEKKFSSGNYKNKS